MLSKPTYEELTQEVKKLRHEAMVNKATLNAVLNASTESAFIIDLDARYIMMNDVTAERFNCSKEELLGKCCFDVVAPEIAKKRKQVFEKVINSGEPFRYKGKRDKMVLDISLHPVLNDEGKVVRVAFFVSDITELKKTEAELSRSEKEINSIFRAVPTGIGVVVDRVLKQVNDRICEMTGYSKSELVNKNARILYPSQVDYEYVGKEKYKQISKHGTGTVETRWQSKDGSIMNILMSSTPLDPNNLQTGVTFTALDITERKKVEADLRESEEKFRSMMESMSDAAYICSPELKITYLNPAMKKKIGRDATGEFCYKAVFKKKEKCPECGFDKIKTGEHFEREVTDPDTNKIYSIVSSPINLSDNKIFKLAIFRDITQVKTMEAQLRQSQKMESIGTLAGGIAHDFNNILGVIIGNAELALDDMPVSNPVYQSLEEIKTASMRASGVVRQLLNFSKKSDQEFKSIGAVSVIKDSINFLRSTIPSSVKINQTLPDEEITIFGDPVQINQIIMNICTNASQEMEENGGTIDIVVEQVSLKDISQMGYTDLKHNTYVKTIIKDNGPGIPVKIMDQIFDPYFTTKDFGKGTGMGLAIVHGLIKNHEGYISVESKMNSGTIFTFLIPCVDGEPQDITQEKGTILQGSERILFVDDEEPNLDMMKKILSRLGYRTDARINPEEALNLFKKNPEKVDIVITDMTMPQMNGIQLSRELMKIRPDIPIIIYTGHNPLIDEYRAKELGIAGFVMKPITISKIAHAIKKAIG